MNEEHYDLINKYIREPNHFPKHKKLNIIIEKYGTTTPLTIYAIHGFDLEDNINYDTKRILSCSLSKNIWDNHKNSGYKYTFHLKNIKYIILDYDKLCTNLYCKEEGICQGRHDSYSDEKEVLLQSNLKFSKINDYEYDVYKV